MPSTVVICNYVSRILELNDSSGYNIIAMPHMVHLNKFNDSWLKSA